MKRNFTIGLTRYWWVPLITGLICIGFGVWCFVEPSVSLPVMAYIFCAGLLVAGLLDLYFAIFNRSANLNWGWSLALGLLEIACGVWLFCMPEPVLTVAFIYAIGIWMIVAALTSVSESLYMASLAGVWWTLFYVLVLIATVVLATIFICNPIMGVEVGWLWLGLSLLFFGIYRICLSGTLYKINRRTDGMI